MSLFRRFFANIAPQVTLTTGATPTDVTIQVTAFSGYPSSTPFYVSLDRETLSEEIVLVTSISGTTATVTRAQGGTSAIAHATGGTVDHVVVAQDLDDANAHILASSGVHGVSGTIVDTSTTQTLANKTLSNPVLTGSTAAADLSVSGTLSGASVSFSGGLSAASVSTGVATVSSVAASGAVSAGSAAIAGALTANSVTSANDVGAATVTATGAVTGLITPKSYTNQAAAGTGTAGQIVYLTAPTGTNVAAGLFTWHSTLWVPLLPSVVGKLRRVAAETVPTSNPTTIFFDTFDINKGGQGSSGGFTVVYAGVYAVSGNIQFASGSASGNRIARFMITGTTDTFGGSAIPAGTANSKGVVLDTELYALNAGDYVGLEATQDSGATVSVTATLTVAQVTY